MTAERLRLETLNAMDESAFVAALAEIFEHGAWVARSVAAARPFSGVTELHDAMMSAVRAASAAERLALIARHPELAGKVARAGALTDASRHEQGSLGLDRLSDAEFARFEELNAAYKARFGFPFIICVRRHTRDSILANFARRLGHDREHEIETALVEIGYITRLRLVAAVEGPNAPKTDGRLSTHVLDTANGVPAKGVAFSLYEVGASARGLVTSGTTNSDGRTDAPLLSGAPLRMGTYELNFDIGSYFAARDEATSDPAFLGVVTLRFSIAEPEGHYHVPLLAAPWSYTTYRGS